MSARRAPAFQHRARGFAHVVACFVNHAVAVVRQFIAKLAGYAQVLFTQFGGCSSVIALFCEST